jgi:hypothetical protein
LALLSGATIDQHVLRYLPGGRGLPERSATMSAATTPAWLTAD